jgi:hypothetical protein
MQRDFIYELMFMYNKRKLVYPFLSLSFTHLTMIYKKRISLLSFKTVKYIVKHGTTDIYESIY